MQKMELRCLLEYGDKKIKISFISFFFSKVNKKPRTFFIVRLVSEKISHPHLATHLIENENN